jgi:hypothetical protein
MVFNNEDNQDRSSVEIWTPPIDENGSYHINDNKPFGPNDPDWEYTAPGFYSKYMSGAHMLPNHNIFICEGMSGRFFEITLDGNLVWDYINPVNQNGGATVQGGTVRFNQTFRATKYATDYAAFAGKNLEPGIPVEIRPWENDCYALEEASISFPNHGIKILGNPIVGQLKIESLNDNENIRLHIYNSGGLSLRNLKILHGINMIDLSDLARDMYFLSFTDGVKLHFTDKLVIH